MIEWLKTTIPGIIILGALGSVLAAGVIWLAKRYFSSVIVRIFVFIVMHFSKPAVSKITNFIIKHDRRKLPLLYTSQIMKLQFALFFALCAFIASGHFLNQADGDLLTKEVLTPLIIFFLSLWYAVRFFAIVVLSLHFDFEGKVDEALEKALSELNKTNKANKSVEATG